jgi:hypothetical protein
MSRIGTHLVESKFTCDRGHGYKVELHVRKGFTELYVLDWRGHVVARRHNEDRKGRGSWSSPDRPLTSHLIVLALDSLPQHAL